MSTVPCPVCSRAVAIVGHDRRKRIRCPECDHLFEASLADGDEPAGKPLSVPSKDDTPAETRGRRDSVRNCERCGEPLWSAANRDSRPINCPQCGYAVAKPSRKKNGAVASDQIKAAPALQATLPAPVPVPAPPPASDDEAYEITGKIRNCPNCQREIADDAVLCVACGYNSATREQAVREFEPVSRIWDGALSRGTRLSLFGAGQTVLFIALIGAALGDFLIMGLCTWIGVTALLAYVLGTFPRLQVTRNRRGYVTVTKTWHAFFVPLPENDIVLGQYAGVRSGIACEADGWDWALLCAMFAMGFIPGCFWWYWTFHRETYFVGLVRDHGSLVLDLYRGFNEPMTREIHQVIRDVAGYPIS